MSGRTPPASRIRIWLTRSLEATARSVSASDRAAALPVLPTSTASCSRSTTAAMTELSSAIARLSWSFMASCSDGGPRGATTPRAAVTVADRGLAGCCSGWWSRDGSRDGLDAPRAGDGLRVVGVARPAALLEGSSSSGGVSVLPPRGSARSTDDDDVVCRPTTLWPLALGVAAAPFEDVQEEGEAAPSAALSSSADSPNWSPRGGGAGAARAASPSAAPS
mmetsp:Transcript_14942/g.59972  ORF Transcript_14942/g.59972 Transcript_14942/m.59972 type:complete len:221 (-) Transcript_14942:512-1174(-)